MIRQSILAIFTFRVGVPGVGGVGGVLVGALEIKQVGGTAALPGNK